MLALVLANLVPLLIGAALPLSAKLLHSLAKWLRAAAARTPSKTDDALAGPLADLADNVAGALEKEDK